MPKKYTKNPTPSTKHTLSLFPGQGVRIVSPTPGACKPANSGGPRGQIREMSSASARRFRSELITHKPIEGNFIGNLTLTVPGPPLTPKEKDYVFNQRFRRYFEKMGWGAFWRMELQKRSDEETGLRAVHWHLACSMNWKPFAGPLTAVPLVTAAGFLRQIISWEWMRILEDLDICEHTMKNGREYVGPRSEIPGAGKYAVHMGLSESPEGQWLRYLCDHATKKKTDQMAPGYGRPWGKINVKDTFEKVPAVDLPDLNQRQQEYFLKYLRRMQLKWRKDPSAPFGFRRGFPNPAGRWGTSYWFGNTADIERLARWTLDVR